jgi:hypothetical protein
MSTLLSGFGDEPFLRDLTRRVLLRGKPSDALYTAFEPIEHFSSKQIDLSQLLPDAFKPPHYETHTEPDPQAILRTIDSSSMGFWRLIWRSVGEFSAFSELDRYLADLTIFWLRELPLRGVSRVVFSGTPHFAWDFVLAEAAATLGIECVVLNPTNLDAIATINERGAALLTPSIGGANTSSIRLLSPEEVSDLIPKPSANLHNSRAINDRALAISSKLLFQRLHVLLRAARNAHLVFRRGPTHATDKYLRLTGPRRWLAQLRNDLRVVRLHDLYDGLCLKSPPKEPFVFFPLHFQPERTTDPEAGLLANQYLSIRAVRGSLDPEVLLLVKEHPRQFERLPSDLRTRYYRDESFYHAVSRLPGVHLIPASMPSADLISEAQSTVTVKGSASFEAMYGGGNASSLSPAWYSRFLEATDEQSTDGQANWQFQLPASSALLASSPENLTFVNGGFVRFCFSKESIDQFGLPYDATVDECVETIFRLLKR